MLALLELSSFSWPTLIEHCAKDEVGIAVADGDGDGDVATESLGILQHQSEVARSSLSADEVGERSEKVNHRSWIERLRSILQPYFQEKQQRTLVVESACSGTGCPTWAMEVRFWASSQHKGAIN